MRAPQTAGSHTLQDRIMLSRMPRTNTSG
jgi:hypothetical protein